MGDIYSTAKQVIVHVGGDDEGQAELARTLIEDVGNMIAEVMATLEEPIPWDSYPMYDANGPIVLDTRWHAVARLSWQPWFRRGWVVQEAALAQNVKLFWNRTELDWHKLLCVAFWLTYKAPFKITGIFRISRPNVHMDHYYTRHEWIARAFLPKPKLSRLTLIECLNQSRNLKVTDGRDQIYAMIHLPSLEPESRYIPHVDYTSSVEEVFRDFAVEHVYHTKTAEVLEYVTHTAIALEMQWSWVPRWHTVIETNWPMQPNRHLERARLHARGGQMVDPVIVGNKVLRAQGAVLDSVVFSSETIHEDPTTIMPTDIVISMLQRIWKSIEFTSECPYEPGWRLEVFLRVVVLNILQDDATAWFQSAATIYLTLTKTSIRPDMIKTPPWVLRLTPAEPDLFCLRASGVLYKRRVILTKRGYIGLAPLETRRGDICAIVFGCRTPCILREADAEGIYRYVGSMYMPGKTMMDILDDDGVSIGIMDVNVLGTEESKDWVEWDDVEEQIINIC